MLTVNTDVCVRARARVRACMYICVRVCIYACTHMCVHAHVCTHMCARTYVHVYTCTRVHVYLSLYVCTSVRLYVCTPVCMHVYVCIYILACGVVVIMSDFLRSDRGSNPGRGGEISIMITTPLLRHHGQVSENPMPLVHPSYVREIGKMETVPKLIGG